MSDRIEPFRTARELNMADAKLNGPWPALYRLIDAYQRVSAERDELRAEVTGLQAALRQILDDPDAHILDSHRDDGWEVLGR